MNSKSRITSILKTKSLDFSVTGIPSFNLSELDLKNDLDFDLPTNLRLGHLAERVVSNLIKVSTNYKLRYENVQVIEDKKTIGEIDFIIEEIASKRIIHLELAYKFYLFDPTISSEPINNWIGPNRNDSLSQKLDKLKRKQFPLLQNAITKLTLDEIDIDKASQALCLLVSLFIPYEYKTSFSPEYENAIEGYYLDFETFSNLNDNTKQYHNPTKKDWGINPAENNIWTYFKGVENYIAICMKEKQAPLIWQKHEDSYESFFIVWW